MTSTGTANGNGNGTDTGTGQGQSTLRVLDRPGDLGWVVMTHGEQYHQEFGWNQDFEALVAKIVADFAGDPERARTQAWVAELNGQRVGSVFCMADSATTARLRILLVTPAARGHGIGRRLVDTCVEFARSAGYTRITLWTNDVLAAARHIYQAAGFELLTSEPHRSFGHDLVGQHWALDL